MRIDETGRQEPAFAVAGRGVLHLSVLMETMRREGFEFQVGRPQVVYKTDEHGNKLEPIEEATRRRAQRLLGQGYRGYGHRRRHHGRHGFRRDHDAPCRSASRRAAPWA